MEIDYAIDLPDEEAAKKVALAAEKAGYRAQVVYDDEDGSWSCYCSKTMIPRYDDVIMEQELLNVLSAPYGGRCDGWGSFGNKDA